MPTASSSFSRLGQADETQIFRKEAGIPDVPGGEAGVVSAAEPMQ
jgi:hypothetical protein